MAELKSVPKVDLSLINGDFDKVPDSAYEKVTKDLGDALTSIGFAYLINHGVDFDKVNAIHKKAKAFFELPVEVKNAYKKRNPAKSFHGYSGPGDEFLNEDEKNSTELREMWDLWGEDGYDSTKFPTEVEGFQASYDSLRPEINNLGKKILRCIGMHLKLQDRDFFVKNHRNLTDHKIKTQTQLRSLYYYTLDPSAEIPPNAIRCGEHSDWGSITFLIQDLVGGLEVKTRQGKWVMATPIDKSILLNLGQLMEIWSGGHLHAAYHRVRILTEGKPALEPRHSFHQP